MTQAFFSMALSLVGGVVFGTASFWQSSQGGGAVALREAPIRLLAVPYRLRSRPKNYEWGARGALSEFLGLDASSEPEAEVWFGDHPFSECSVETLDGPENFSSWLRESGEEFPLLVKVLAAQKPLSIQVHPSEEQALRGFFREEAAGIPLGAADRTYKDQSAKPELLIALSDDFVAMVGFAPEARVLGRLDRWVADGAPPALQNLFGPVAGIPRESSRIIVTADEGLAEVVDELGEWISSWSSLDLSGDETRDRELLRKIHRAHPHDPGILFTLVMNHFVLRRGEAVFVDAGQVHAYLGGMGLEVMLPSDNVIRAGLTKKHKDHEAFMELAVFDTEDDPLPLVPTIDGSVAMYRDFGASFSVKVITAGVGELTVGSPSVCFVERGFVDIASSAGSQRAGSGEVFFSLPSETLRPVSDDVVVWVVQADFV